MPRITITVPEHTAQPYRFPLDRTVVRLGRGDDNDIVIDSGSVSGYHAEMRHVLGGYELHDIGSTNGITLDEERHAFIPLRSGMSLKVGDVTFDFLLTSDELEALSYELAPPAPVLASPEVTTPAAPARAVPRAVTSAAPSQSSGTGSMFVLLLLAIVAFSVGLAIRFQKETGASFYQAVQAKFFPSVPTPKS